MAVVDMEKIEAQIKDLESELETHEQIVKDDFLADEEFTLWLKKKKSIQGKISRRKAKLTGKLSVKRSPSKCISNMFGGKYAWQCPHCKQWWYSQQAANECKSRDCATEYQKRWCGGPYDGGYMETFYPIDPSKIF
jgi:hypothetical protein